MYVEIDYEEFEKMRATISRILKEVQSIKFDVERTMDYLRENMDNPVAKMAYGLLNGDN